MLVLLVLIAGFLFWYSQMKSLALQGAEVINTQYNSARTCYAQTVQVSLDGKVNPILETLFYLLHSELFYRVFNKDGELVTSTDWRFLEPTVDTDHARWTNNSTLVYPADGYRSLNASQCGDVPGKG